MTLETLRTEKFLSPVRIAKKFDVSKRLIYRLMAKGDLPFVIIGGCKRISESALFEYLKAEQPALK